jgi:hypothetical protein
VVVVLVVVVVVVAAAAAAVAVAVAVAGCCSYRKGQQPIKKSVVNDFKLVLQARNTVCVFKVSYCAQSA